MYPRNWDGYKLFPKYTPYSSGHMAAAFLCRGYAFGPTGTVENRPPLNDRGIKSDRGMGSMATNPRYKNGNLRRKYRARFKAMNAECGICKGRLGPIHYDEPSNAKHPMSFVIDEIHPVSRWKEFGYASAAQAAQDWNNCQAAHYACNAAKSNKDAVRFFSTNNRQDGEW